VDLPNPVNADEYHIVEVSGPTSKKVTHRNKEKVVLTKDQWIYPEDMVPFVTDGAVSAIRDLGTNVALETMNFAAAADDSISFVWHPPEKWDALTVTFALVWTNESGIAAETIDFDLSARSYADSDALNQAPGTAQNVTDIWLAQDDTHITSFSSAITIAGTPLQAQPNIFKLTRDTAADDLTGTADIIALILRYGTVDNSST